MAYSSAGSALVLRWHGEGCSEAPSTCALPSLGILYLNTLEPSRTSLGLLQDSDCLNVSQSKGWLVGSREQWAVGSFWTWDWVAHVQWYARQCVRHDGAEG